LAGFFTAGFNDLGLSFGFGSVLRLWSPESPASSGSIQARQKGYSTSPIVFFVPPALPPSALTQRLGLL
jgi:hypothetical protein